MFVACQGLPAVVILLADAANGRELVLLAVDAIKAVLDMRGRSPRNDLCRTLVDPTSSSCSSTRCTRSRRTTRATPTSAPRSSCSSCADPVVKARMATGRAGGRVLHGLMRVLESREFRVGADAQGAPLREAPAWARRRTWTSCRRRAPSPTSSRCSA